MDSNGYGVTDKRKEAVNFSPAIYWDTISLLTQKSSTMKPYLDQYSDLKIAYSEPVDDATSVMFQKNNLALMKAYNAQLKAMSDDGTFKKLYEKYFANLPVPSSLIEIYPEFAK